MARVWSWNQQCSRISGCGAQSIPTRCSIQNFGGMVPHRDLPTSGMRDAVSAFHHESCVQGCHEGCTPGSDERQRTQLRFKGQQGLEVVPSSSQVTFVSFSERGARPEEAVGRPSPPLPCRPVVRVVGKQRVPTKSHPDVDAAFNVTRRRDGRTEHVLWFRWESFPPQEERWKRYLWHLEPGNVGQIDRS